MSDRDGSRTRGTVPFMDRPERPFVKPAVLPKSFLYYGPGLFLGHLDVLIEQQGVRVVHTHGVACPCHETQQYGGTGAAVPDCSACHGVGLAFIEDESAETRALVSDIDEKETGNLPAGAVRVTFPSGFVVAPGDRLVFPDVALPIALMRKYRARVGGIRVPFTVLDVEAIATKRRDPKSPLMPLKRGKDYTLDTSKRLITFPSGSVVTDGMVVSASFMATPDYIIEEAPKAYRSRMSNLLPGASVIQLPKFVYAIRADALIGTRYREVSGKGDVHE